jgi:hypothetical protein
MPTLASLTVRTNTVDNLGPGKLWSWIKDIIPNAGLKRLKLHAFTMTGEIRAGSALGTMVPRMFLLDLARIHGDSLKEFDIGNVELTMSDVRCLKAHFEQLELLACAVAVPDVVSRFHHCYFSSLAQVCPVSDPAHGFWYTKFTHIEVPRSLDTL